MNDTLFWAPVLIVVGAVVRVLIALGLYAAFVLFIARMLSSKWHPDGGG